MNGCSVVIVAKHSGTLLFATIESVLRQKGLSELIVVDNGNPPAVLARLQQKALSNPVIKIVSGRNEFNMARSCNIAARQAISENILFLKVGYILGQDALSSLVNALSEDEKILLSSGVVQNYDGSLQVNSRVKVITPKSVFLNIFGINSDKKLKEQVAVLQSQEKPFEVVSVTGACICIKAANYKKLGGFDEEFASLDEEIDFSLRVKQVGGRILCLPAVKITALPYGLVSHTFLEQKLREFRNISYYLKKFFAEHQFFGTLFLLKMLLFLRLLFDIAVFGVLSLFRKSPAVKNEAAAKKLMLLVMGEINIAANDRLKKKIVLVTGATGQIGICVIRRLIASGAAVLALNRQEEIPYSHPHLRWLKKDLTDTRLDLDGYCVDAVVHCAPLWHLPPVMEMLEKSEAKRIIAFSSTSIFSKLLSANEFEKDFVLKLQNAENLLAEKCSAFNINYTVFRPTQVYGVGLDNGITTVAKIIRKFGCIFVYPPAFGRRQPVHADDLANAVVQAMSNEKTYGKSYNLSGGEIIPYREMLGRIFSLLGFKQRIINNTALPFMLDLWGKITGKKYINGEIARRMNDDMVFFHDDAKHDFGFKSRKFLAGGTKDIE